MQGIEYGSVADLQAGRDVEVGPTEWFVVDQARVNRFADATDDHQWIHVDPERARSGPFGATIAHGYLTLSLIPRFTASLRRLSNVRMTINYGLGKVRFPSPVRVGARLRATSMIVRVDVLDETSAQVTTRMAVEIENEPKPACVADTIARIYFSP